MTNLSKNYPVEGEQKCFESSDRNSMKAIQTASHFCFNVNINIIISRVKSLNSEKALGTIIDRKRSFTDNVTNNKAINYMITRIRNYFLSSKENLINVYFLLQLRYFPLIWRVIIEP